MSLNIKNPETHRLAKELAKHTGESMSDAVNTALRERLKRVRRARKSKATAEELMAIGRRLAKDWHGPAPDHDELLYDDNGLPK
jgi:antitoxin VapB